MSDDDLVIDPDAFSPEVVREPLWDVLLMIAIGGAFGGGVRYLISIALPHSAGTFPWSTFLVNVIGCFLLGLLIVLVTEVWTVHRYTRPLLGVGFLGGFTTFSTYILDAHTLAADGHAAQAMVYLFGSVIVGLAAAYAGMMAGRRFRA